MPIIPTSASTNVPTYSIYVEGVEINSSYRILNINVNKEYNKILSSNKFLYYLFKIFKKK